MAGIRAAAEIITPVAAIVFGAAAAQTAPVRSEVAACTAATARAAAQLQRAPSSIPGCEPVGAADSPQGFYVLALRGRCRETVCGSTLIGWYAVEKGTGHVFEWDVAEWRLGSRIG